MLSDLLDRVQRRMGLSLRQFAQHIFLDRCVLSDVKAKRRERILYRTYLSLHRGLWEYRKELERCFMTQYMVEISEAQSDSQLTPEGEVGLVRAERLRLQRIADRLDVRPAIKATERELNRYGHSPDRIVQCFRTVLEPLNRFYTSFGVELGMDDMTDDELAEYLRLGLRWQRLLLRREFDLVRIQEVADRLPEIIERLRSPQLGETDAHHSWDFRDAEKRFASSKALEPKVGR